MRAYLPAPFGEKKGNFSEKEDRIDPQTAEHLVEQTKRELSGRKGAPLAH
jgi:hypothetical protein